MDTKINLSKKDREEILSSTKIFASVVEKIPIEEQEKKDLIFKFMSSYAESITGEIKSKD
jgi:hypothetical protein